VPVLSLTEFLQRGVRLNKVEVPTVMANRQKKC
jgi:hypothetical protein